jgi:hypothetical protein
MRSHALTPKTEITPRHILKDRLATVIYEVFSLRSLYAFQSDS